MAAQLETYLTLEEFAEHVRVAVETVRSWIKRGCAPRVTNFNGGKVLFAASDIQAWEADRRASV